MICNDCWLIMPTLGPSCSAFKGPSALTTTVPPNGQRVCGSAGLRVRCTKGHKLVQYLAILGTLSTKNQDKNSSKCRGFWSNYWANCYNSLFLNYIRALWRDFSNIIGCDLGWGCYSLHRKYRIVKLFPNQPTILVLPDLKRPYSIGYFFRICWV